MSLWIAITVLLAVGTNHDLELCPPTQLELQSSVNRSALRIGCGELLGHRIEISTHLVPRRPFRLRSAGDLTDLYVTSLRTGPRTPVCSYDLVEPSFKGFWQPARERAMAVRMRGARVVPGPYGIDPFASEMEGEILAEPSTWPHGGSVHLKAGLLHDTGYLIEVTCRPAANQRVREILSDFFSDGVRYTGATRDPLWSSSEILERWRECQPDGVRPKILRTDHYLVIGDASFGRALGRRLERIYQRVQDEFPFPEWSGRRLMPVFLFRHKHDFQRFSSRQCSGASRGLAWGDAFATWYESPTDPVLTHEAVHQLFANRLHLPGGGSWFQEGVAEYLAHADWERSGAARRLAKVGPIDFRELIEARRLSEATGPKAIRSRYEQAGLMIDYLSARDPGGRRFRELITSIGSLAPGRPDLIDASLRRLYGTDLEQFERSWRGSLDGR